MTPVNWDPVISDAYDALLEFVHKMYVYGYISAYGVHPRIIKAGYPSYIVKFTGYHDVEHMSGDFSTLAGTPSGNLFNTIANAYCGRPLGHVPPYFRWDTEATLNKEDIADITKAWGVPAKDGSPIG